MAKATPDGTIAAGERLLAAWGLTAESGPAELGAALERDPAADLAIAHRLGAIAVADSAVILRRLERTTGDKQIRKAAKRALYRLAQRGVVLEDTPPPERAPAPGPRIEGYVSAIDGHGDQLVWLVKAQPGGVLHLFAIINDPDGLRETALTPITRKALKGLREELERKHAMRLVEVDWRYADFLMHRAFEWAQAHATRMTGDYPGLRAQFSPQPPSESPAMPAPEPAGAAAEDAALAASAELLDAPELRTWFRTEAELRPDLEQLTAVRESPLVLNAMQQEERFEAITAAAVDRVFGGPQRLSWIRRLEGMGVYFAASGRADRAAQVNAVARALAGDRPAREVPFCALLVRASLAYFFHAATEAAEEREKTSLVLTPQQIAARQRPR